MTTGDQSRRILGPWSVTGTIVSNMIGTGVFTTTGLIAGMGAAEGDILLAWLAGGIIALCGALCYGELGAHFPGSGGEYYYLSRVLHPAVGFMSGCVSLVAGFAAPIAAAAMAMHLYFAKVSPGWPVSVGAAGTIAIVAALHARDLKLGSQVQTVLIGVKATLISVFIVSAFSSAGFDLSRYGTTTPGFWGSPTAAVALVFVFFAYSGWNAAAYIGGEIQEPERTLPKALLAGTLFVTLLYMGLNLTYLAAVPATSLAGTPEVGFAAALALWGPDVAAFVSLAVALTLISPISAMTLVGPRVLEAMAADRLLPAAVGRLNARSVPSTAVWLQSGVAMTVALTSSFDTLLIYIGFTLNIFASLTVISLMVLRARGEIRRKICVAYPVPPLLYLLFAGWMTIWSIQAQPMATIAALATLAMAAFLYRLTAPGDVKSQRSASDESPPSA